MGFLVLASRSASVCTVEEVLKMPDERYYAGGVSSGIATSSVRADGSV
jgi:hypothetical protein